MSIEDEDLIISDNLEDCNKTTCKICYSTFPLTYMRNHTLKKHQIQVTKYKEKYGEFEIIEPQIYHKCHLCNKLLLLDRDRLGGHIKGTHKMKETDYMTKYMTYARSVSKRKTSPVPPRLKKSRRKPSREKAAADEEIEPAPPSKADSPINIFLGDEEYFCNEAPCEFCERAKAIVKLDPLETSFLLEELDYLSRYTDEASKGYTFSPPNSPGFVFSPRNIDGINSIGDDYMGDRSSPVRESSYKIAKEKRSMLATEQTYAATIVQNIVSLEKGLAKGNIKQIRDKLLGESGTPPSSEHDISDEIAFLDSDSSDSFTEVSTNSQCGELKSILSDQDKRMMSEMSYSEIMENINDCMDLN